MKHSILLYTESPEPSGVGEHMLSLAAGLQVQYRLLLACPPTPAGMPLLARAEDMTLETLRLDHLDGLARWLGEQGIDLMHNHAGIGWEGHAGIYAAREAGLPVIRTEHLPYLLTDPVQQAAHQRMLAAVDILICVSEGARRTFEAAGIDPALLRVVRNGVPDVAVPADRAGVRQALGLPAQCPLVLTVGRFTPQKNYTTLLEAVPAVLLKHPQTRFVWVGEGPLWDRLRGMVQGRGLTEYIHFLGQRSDVPRLMAAADLFVLPSQFEGLPLVILEAMACGLPVVGTRVCGIEEVVKNGVTGQLVPVDDVQALTEAIHAGLEDTDRHTQWRSQARAAFAHLWRADRMTREIGAVYEELLTSVPRPPVWAGSPTPRQSLPEPTFTRPAAPQLRTMKTRVGFIGSGGIATRHMGNLMAFDDVEIIAMADPVLERAATAAARCGGRAYDRYEAMLDAHGLDAVYICVPPFAHGPLEATALQRHLPFFVEKPVALDYATAQTIATEVEAQGLVTAVGYHWRYLDIVEQAQELLNRNPARLVLGYWLSMMPPSPWWGTQAQSGGQIVEQTTHIFDLARLLIGEVETVYVVGAHTPRAAFPDADIDDVSVATLRFATGAIGTIASTCLLNWHHRIGLHLFCNAMVLEISESELMIDVGQGRPVTLPQGDPFVWEDRDFIDAVQGKANRIRVPYHEALRTHRLATSAEQSLRQGRTIYLNQGERSHVS